MYIYTHTYISGVPTSTRLGQLWTLFSRIELLFWFPVLIYFWTKAEDYKFDWAGAFQKRIEAEDIDWLKRAMAHTFSRLNSEDKETIKIAYEEFLFWDKIADWKQSMSNAELELKLGPEATARIWGNGYETTRSARGHSLQECAEKLCRNPGDKIHKWIYVPAVFAGQKQLLERDFV